MTENFHKGDRVVSSLLAIMNGVFRDTRFGRIDSEPSSVGKIRVRIDGHVAAQTYAQEFWMPIAEVKYEDYLLRAYLYQECVVNEQAMTMVGDALGVSGSTVRRWMEKYRIGVDYGKSTQI